jgi:hypothetical protein
VNILLTLLFGGFITKKKPIIELKQKQENKTINNNYEENNQKFL